LKSRIVGEGEKISVVLWRRRRRLARRSRRRVCGKEEEEGQWLGKEESGRWGVGGNFLYQIVGQWDPLSSPPVLASL